MEAYTVFRLASVKSPSVSRPAVVVSRRKGRRTTLCGIIFFSLHAFGILNTTAVAGTIIVKGPWSEEVSLTINARGTDILPSVASIGNFLIIGPEPSSATQTNLAVEAVFLPQFTYDWSTSASGLTATYFQTATVVVGETLNSSFPAITIQEPNGVNFRCFSDPGIGCSNSSSIDFPQSSASASTALTSGQQIVNTVTGQGLRAAQYDFRVEGSADALQPDTTLSVTAKTTVALQLVVTYTTSLLDDVINGITTLDFTDLKNRLLGTFTGSNAGANATANQAVLIDAKTPAPRPNSETTIDLIEHSPDFIIQSLVVPDNALTLYIPFNWVNTGDDDFFGILLDQNLVWSQPSSNFLLGTQYFAIFDVTAYQGKQITLAYLLESGGDVNARVSLGREVSFSTESTHQVPEPASLLLTGLGLMGFGFSRRFRENK